MGQNRSLLLRIHTRRQVNTGFEQAQNEGRVDLIRDPYIIFQPDRSSELSLQPPIRQESVKQEQGHAGQPDTGRQTGPDLQGINSGSGRGRQRFLNPRINKAVHSRNAAMDFRLFRKENLRRHGFHTGNKTKLALDRKGKDQAQSQHSPEQESQPPRRLFQKQAQD